MPVTDAATPALRTPRERARAQTVADIVRLGREHLARHGAAALSLRAVARELGVVSSAVYRYVQSRDELLTLLLIDAYGELGDEVDAAVGRVAEGDFAGRFRALGRAVRGWALREPARYALLFGSPVPGYRAPAERTTEPGTRVVYSLMALLDNAWRAGALGAESGAVAAAPPAAVPPALAADLKVIREERGLGLTDGLLARGALVWTSLFGAISFEVFGQYGEGTFSARDELFEHHLQVLAGIAGLE
ncbi:AcrR family transcriptional regulator [Arthrobacter sp. PvP102]|jgi:AcrR family transcriptional regulator|uniref:TetR/AcrR family transcriptional regulator n=1 Tax=unclassified Arthrobacter TaxID=235627 RepID=UPI001AE0F652|nr:MULTISPECIES: TetR/AcrR family transcriptional regulator [unclassified Arthrobacter]MBP1233203.1 AcrR family transcriptional regulator [Arthrobacter sp. PvP103]MBP1238338.1 AcrR family transcriptional regulator [Arthrobacter sp. PvP102]